MAMYYKEYDHFLAGIQHALTLPIRTRCAELTVLLDRGGRSLLELHNIFPLLIDNIFGPQGTICWGLRVVSELQYEDYRQLHYFLSPCGPMFNLIYTLLKDPNIKYEFQLAFLPVKIRQFLEHPIAHPFYSELLNINSNKQVTSLLLNPFDYYFFHFAYHLINPWQQRTGSSVSSWNTVYYSLCCDYILHFLPTDPSANILPAIYYNGKNPNQLSKSSFQQQSKSSVVNQGLSSSIIILNKNIDDKSFVNLDRHHPRNEIWRSETILTLFTDMWFHNDAVNASLNNSFDKNGSMRIHYNELPTGEYMRIVRVLIKQLHSFSNSAKADDTPLGELKKIAIPMIQGKFYVFLRNLIHRWPMDGSFRLVLELWLTYIQPWRYPANSLIKKLQNENQNPDADDVALNSDKQQYTVTPEYLPFIAENLLCYVVIFQQLLPRFARVDLVSPKMAVMLYRITKVFDQPELPGYLREIEQCIENNQQSSPPKHARSFSDNLPPLSPHNWSSYTPIRRNFDVDLSFHRTPSGSFLNNVIGHDKKWSAVVRQKMYELEGPTFAYTKLFSVPPAQEVYNLISQIQKSVNHAQNLLRAKEEEERKLYSGFWGTIKYFFLMPTTNDEFSLNDRKKVPIYLEVSINNLKDMFGIEDEDIFQDIEPTLAPAESLENITHSYQLLTPERVKRRLKTIKYDGDPDLQPIRSHECTFLVRSLYHLAVKINEEFGPQIYRLYHEPSYVGRVCRQLFSPPLTVYKYDKSIPGSPRVQSSLPPRVSLRACASFRFIFYLFIGAVVSWLFSYRLDSYLVFLLLIFFFYKLVRAIPNDEYPIRHHNYPTQGFGNISFNDSF